MFDPTLFAVVFCAIFGSTISTEIIFEDAYIVDFNEDYLKDPAIIVNDESDLQVVANLTIVKDFPDDCSVIFFILGADMGEYKVRMTELDFNASLCELLDEPIFLGPFVKSLGFSEENCPPKIGYYATNEIYSGSAEELPDVLTNNSYKSKFIIDCGNKLIVDVESLFVVQ